MPETATADPRVLFSRALEQAQHVIEGVSADDFSSATPCTEYDVATVINHLTGAVGHLRDAFSGDEVGEIDNSNGEPEGGFGEAFSAAGAIARASMEDDALLEKMITLPWATLPGAAIVQMYALETVLHTWDIAVSTGQVPDLDDALAAAVLPIAMQMIPPEPRGGEMPFEAMVATAPDASDYDRLAGYSGRKLN